MTPAEQVAELAARPELREAGWDTYSAKPIPYAALWNALAFALALPDDCQAGCHVAPESSGEVLFEWSGSSWVMSLSIDQAAECDWLGEDENGYLDGRFSFTGAIPENLLAAIRSLK